MQINGTGFNNRFRSPSDNLPDVAVAYIQVLAKGSALGTAVPFRESCP